MKVLIYLSTLAVQGVLGSSSAVQQKLCFDPDGELRSCQGSEIQSEPICIDTNLDVCSKLERSDCILHFEEMSAVCPKTCLQCENWVETNTEDSPFAARNLYSFEFPQNVPHDNQKYANATYEVITSSDQYMYDMFISGSQDEFTILNCTNKNEDCSRWAALGECDKNPGYMHQYCAPACKTCHLLEKPFETRCALPKDINKRNEFIKPGDLNKRFLDMVTNKFPDKVEIHSGPKDLTGKDAIPDGPWLITIDDFITEDESSQLIELSEIGGFERSGFFVGYDDNGDVISDTGSYRTSSTWWCNEALCKTNSSALEFYKRVQDVTGISTKNYEDMQFLKYEKGEQYKVHQDCIEEHGQRFQGLRILTALVYLNDVEAGGGTNFPEIGKKVMPKRGRVVIWPNVYDEDPSKEDERTSHAATPVEKGVKYASNLWLHEREFVSGCE